MGNLDYIESYFKGVKSDSEKKEFEKKILEDAAFAEEVAFYLSADGVIRQQIQDEKKERFRAIYEQHKVVSIKPVKKLWRYMAAASVIAVAVVLSWLFSSEKISSKQLADKYIQQNWQILSVTMGDQDSLQKGLSFFNSENGTGNPKKLTEALAIFESLLKKDSSNSEAKEYAGITFFRLGNYDKALQYFTMLEADSSYSNPGKFYKSVVLLERNKSGDKTAAKLLLQQVIDNDLEGKEQAVEWLKKIE